MREQPLFLSDQWDGRRDCEGARHCVAGIRAVNSGCATPKTSAERSVFWASTVENAFNFAAMAYNQQYVLAGQMQHAQVSNN
jgi:hypothetical protein